MSPPLTINTIPAEHGAVEHQLVDAVGWIHARLYNCSDADADAVATAVKSALEGRPTPVPVFDIPAALDPPSPDLADDLQAVGYVEGWNACAQLMRKGVEDSERMVSLRASSPLIAVPRWVFAMAMRIANYMESQHNGEWAIDRIMSRRPDSAALADIDHVRSILLTIASSARDDAAVAGAKRALDILDGQAEKAPLPDANEGDFDCPKAAQARACPCGFCVALRSGPPAPAVTSMAHPDFGMQSRSNAWERVAKTLGEVSPSWITSRNDMSGIECAVAEIKALAKAAGSAAAGVPAEFTAAARRLAFAARTSGGTAGRDAELCAALDAIEPMLAAAHQPEVVGIIGERGGPGSRESAMVVIQRDASGTPTVWCDPEIADLVTALNAGGIPTAASCSGHGVRAGVIALVDGRELVVVPDYDSGRRLERLTKNHARGDVDGIQPDLVVSPACAGPSPGEPFDYGSLTIPAAAREALARECGTEGIPINQADEE